MTAQRSEMGQTLAPEAERRVVAAPSRGESVGPRGPLRGPKLAQRMEAAFQGGGIERPLIRSF